MTVCVSALTLAKAMARERSAAIFEYENMASSRLPVKDWDEFRSKHLYHKGQAPGLIIRRAGLHDRINSSLMKTLVGEGFFR